MSQSMKLFIFRLLTVLVSLTESRSKQLPFVYQSDSDGSQPRLDTETHSDYVSLGRNARQAVYDDRITFLEPERHFKKFGYRTEEEALIDRRQRSASSKLPDSLITFPEDDDISYHTESTLHERQGRSPTTYRTEHNFDNTYRTFDALAKSRPQRYPMDRETDLMAKETGNFRREFLVTAPDTGYNSRVTPVLLEIFGHFDENSKDYVPERFSDIDSSQKRNTEKSRTHNREINVDDTSRQSNVKMTATKQLLNHEQQSKNVNLEPSYGGMPQLNRKPPRREEASYGRGDGYRRNTGTTTWPNVLRRHEDGMWDNANKPAGRGFDPKTTYDEGSGNVNHHSRRGSPETTTKRIPKIVASTTPKSSSSNQRSYAGTRDTASQTISKRVTPMSPLDSSHAQIPVRNSSGTNTNHKERTSCPGNDCFHLQTSHSNPQPSYIPLNPSYGGSTNKTKGNEPQMGSGDIVFPGSQTKDNPDTEAFVPRIGKDGPKCANGNIFCEEVDEFQYPGEHIKKVLNEKGAAFMGFFGDDEAYDINITQRIDSRNEEHLCPSVERWIKPKMAKNKENEWLFIANEKPYNQSIRTETCFPNRDSCDFTSGFPTSYTTECVQKYMIRKLIALNRDGEPFVDSFQIPTCCTCVVRRIGLGRMGNISANISVKNKTSFRKPQ